MAISAASLLLILSLSGLSQSISPGPRCGYHQVQQMFDLAKYGTTGCIKLKSLAFIFGDGQDNSPKLTAARFLTANLVFTGIVTHVTKDASVPQGTAYKATVKVHCYLKGRLSGSEIVLSGFQADASTGLCLGINCQVGDVGLFFTTYVAVDDIRINENGLVKDDGPEFDLSIQALRCRENYDMVNFWPADGQQTSYCHRIDPVLEQTCQMSTHIAQVYLDHAFIHFESDLKPECQEGKDYVMRQVLMPPLSTSPAFGRLSSDVGGASRLSHSSSTAIAVALLLLTVHQLLARCVAI